jgi:adenylyltransferase/sulfurtransferase
MTHRQKLNWQVGFLFSLEIEAKAARSNRPQVGNREKEMAVPEIRVEELKQRLDAGENLFLLDVRDESEYDISNIGGQLIPLPELARRVNELDVHQKIVTICKMGPRGAKAVQLLHKAGFDQVWNLTGGIHAWSDRVDHSVPKY